MHIDIDRIRREFPLLRRQIDGRPIIYLDSAATSLKPQPVIDAINEYYTGYTANIKRGIHPLADEATDRYEASRQQVAAFINADCRDIVFVRNTTEAINLVARSMAPEDTVLYGLGEHHSNALPWRQLPKSEFLPIQHDGGIDCEFLQKRLATGDARLLALAHVSNAFGAINPIKDIIALAHHHGCRVLVDASQSVPHQRIDVAALECDYLCFSGHKMCGPSGIGVLYGTCDGLQALTPLNYGGAMVTETHSDRYVVSDVPFRFEAGTPFIEGAIGLGAACRYLSGIGMESIQSHLTQLVAEALDGLSEVKAISIHGPLDPVARGPSVTFTFADVESHAVARMLASRYNIFVRSGHHCAQPAHEALGLRPSIRASMYIYNDHREVSQFVDALHNIGKYCVN